MSATANAQSGSLSMRDLRFAVLLFPLFLGMAYYSVLPFTSLDGLLLTGLSFAGIALLLLAALTAQIRSSLTAVITLSFYSAVLACAALFANADNGLVWAMVLGLPLEIWLVTRHKGGVAAGCVIAATLVALSLAKGVQTPVLLPAGVATAFLFTYIGAVLLRVLRLTIHQTTAQTAAQKATLPATATQLDADQELESVLNGLVLRLDRDGGIRSLSDRAVAQLGVERALLVGTALLDRVHVADRVQYLAFLNGLQHEGAALLPSGKIRIRLRCVDKQQVVAGHPDNIYFTSFEMEGRARETGAESSFLIVARSVAGADGLENRLVQQSTQIENLEVSRGRLLGTVSHELRTPLNSIIGFSDLLLHDVAGPLQSDKQREYIDLIRKSGNHLLDVVNGILEASRLEAGHYPVSPECFSVRESIKMCASMLMPLAEKKGVILCDRIHPAVTDMVADRRAVQQILINLVSNAIKFTDRGGCVTIEVMPEQAARGYNKQATGVVLSVSDTGIGLEAHEIERLCQPFSQINNVQTRMQEGSGLGLYLVKGLVSLHHGEMKIRSIKGQGTSVSVHLPQSATAGQSVVDNAGKAAYRPLSADKAQNETSAVTVHEAFEQVKTALINLQAQQAESSYDGKTEPQRHETQGEFHAQKRKTA